MEYTYLNPIKGGMSFNSLNASTIKHNSIRISKKKLPSSVELFPRGIQSHLLLILLQLLGIQLLGKRLAPIKTIELVYLKSQLPYYIHRYHSQHYYNYRVRSLQSPHCHFSVLSHVFTMLISHVVLPCLVSIRNVLGLFIKTRKVPIVRVRSRLAVWVLCMKTRLKWVCRLVWIFSVIFSIVPVCMLRVIKFVLFFISLTGKMLFIVLFPLS